MDLHMKLGDNGEAFFVEENENMEVRRPAFDWRWLCCIILVQSVIFNSPLQTFLFVPFNPRSQPISAPPQFLLRPQRRSRRPLRDPSSLGLAHAGRNAVANAYVLTLT